MNDMLSFRVVTAPLADGSVLCQWIVRGPSGAVELKAKRYTEEGIASQFSDDNFCIPVGLDVVWMPLDVAVHSLVPLYATPDAMTMKWSDLLQDGPVYFEGYPEPAPEILRAWLAADGNDKVIEDALTEWYRRHMPS